MKISFFLLFSCALASVAAIGEIPPTNIAVAQPLSNARSDANGNGCSYAGGRTITNYPPNYPCPSAVGTAGGAFPATGSASTPNPFLGGFLDVTIADASDNSNPPFSDMVDMSFTDNTNELFVATKPGYAFRIDLTTGERSVFMDLTAQTTNSGDRGLSHIITHPDFKNNPYVYLSYSVNPKPGTDGNAINANEVTWQRIIRVTKNSNNQVADGSTIVILGQDATNGIPMCFNSHMGGGMVFGHDGSLFIATGDGAHSDNITAGDYGQVMPGTSDYDPQCKVLFGDQAAGSFRAQMLDSISGKVLRIDPTTGDGICSSSQGYKVLNPYCSNNAKDARSKVWAMGLRHPWTTTLKPLQSGEDQDSPGTIYVGDVGFVSYEEINAVERGGNYGWPCWEGPLPTPSFRDSALDPLTNENGFLTRVYNGSQAINCAWMYKNVKTDMPFYYYSRYDESGGLANYDNGYLGQNVKGTCVGGLAFYNSDSYPAQYKNSLFFVDFGALWVKVLFADANNQVNKVQDFQTYSLAMISLQNNPQGDICYLINQGGIHCIQYDASVIAPYTYAAATPTSGPGPLTVQFSSDGSYDRANHPVTFIWSFGDGSNATTLPNPVHTFTRDGTYTVTLTGINDAGKYQNKTVTINVGPNFSTPFINMTIVGEGFTQIAVSDKLAPLTATPEDPGSGFPPTPTAYGNWKFYDGINTNQLTFSASTNVANPKIRWEAQTVHTNHIHPDTIVKETAGFSADAISLVASGHSQERANVRLLVTVTDENGNQDTAQMFFLAAQRLFWKEYVQHPPTPQVVVNGTSFSQYQPVIFDARTSYDVDTDFLFYTWFFGDGVTATDNFVSHAYSAPGTYEVRMVMNDNYMGFTEWKTTITVNAAPLPSIPILPEDGAETKSSISPTGLATSGSNNGPNDGGVVSQSETQFTSGVEKVFPSILVAVLVLCLLIQ